MNSPVLDMLTPVEKALIASDLASLISDTDITHAVTYKKFVSKVRNPATGSYTVTYTDYAIRAARNEISVNEVNAGQGVLQLGDVRFLFAAAHLPIVPSTEDRIVLGSETYEVIMWAQDPLAVSWRMAARRVK